MREMIGEANDSLKKKLTKKLNKVLEEKNKEQLNQGKGAEEGKTEVQMEEQEIDKDGGDQINKDFDMIDEKDFQGSQSG